MPDFKLPVLKSRSTMSEASAEPASESSITYLRFQRSTSTPANGDTTSVGTRLKKPTSASVVACPVSCHAQIVRPKVTMLEPRYDAA